MAKGNGKGGILDFFKMKDLDDDEEFADDLFDDEDEYEPQQKRSSKPSAAPKQAYSSDRAYSDSRTQSHSYSAPKQQNRNSGYQKSSYNNIVEMNKREDRPQPVQQKRYVPRDELYVIKPMDLNDARTIIDYMKRGNAIVINIEGVEIATAQTIVDFVSGGTFALGGSFKMISDNILVATPESVQVSGDFKDEDAYGITQSIRQF